MKYLVGMYLYNQVQNSVSEWLSIFLFFLFFLPFAMRWPARTRIRQQIPPSYMLHTRLSLHGERGAGGADVTAYVTIHPFPDIHHPFEGSTALEEWASVLSQAAERVSEVR